MTRIMYALFVLFAFNLSIFAEYKKKSSNNCLNLKQVSDSYVKFIEKNKVLDNQKKTLEDLSYYFTVYNNNLSRFLGFKVMYLYYGGKIRNLVASYNDRYNSLDRDNLQEKLLSAADGFHVQMLESISEWEALDRMYSDYKGHIL
jgi:hypothetical protein